MFELIGIDAAGTQMIVVFFLLMALRVPVAFALGLSALYAMWKIGFGLELAGDLIATSITKFSLLAIPFFILAGNLMNAIGLHHVDIIMAITLLIMIFAASVSGVLLHIDRRLPR